MRLTREARRERRRQARAYAARLIARINARRLELMQADGFSPVLPDGTCAVCLGAGRIIRANATWKRCPCSN